jgi:prepilin-type N-terminal cleavage/methylation domain-containing protein
LQNIKRPYRPVLAAGTLKLHLALLCLGVVQMAQKTNRRMRRGVVVTRFQQFWFRRSSEAGLTLIETLVALVIAGILAAILAPGWLGLQTNTLLNAAQDEAFQAIRQTQVKALQTRQPWQVGFRELNRQVEWAVYRSDSAASAIPWQPLRSGVQIARNQTTLSQNGTGYFVEFNNRGNVTPPFGRLTLVSSRGGRSQRCVFVSTLLGTLRKASDTNCGTS